MPVVAILPLDASHAQDAARLHLEGQPGTFLTSLGSEALIALYTAIPESSAGFGFAAVTTDGRTVGFVSAAASTGALFLHVMARRSGRFLPILLRRFAARPSLLIRVCQATLYPLLIHEAGSNHAPAAELLSIMVEADLRSHGLGAVLLAALMVECERRGVTKLDVTVDAANLGAQRFYARHGFHHKAAFYLFGRRMYLLQRSFSA